MGLLPHESEPLTEADYERSLTKPTEPASPVRDDRTWTIARARLIEPGTYGPWRLWDAFDLDAAVDVGGWEMETLVPRSELARVQERYQQMCSKEMSAWQKLEVLSEQLAKRGEALKEIASIASTRGSGWAHQICELARAASGVTEKED